METTVQGIKKALMDYQQYMNESRRFGEIREQMARRVWNEKIGGLQEPDETSFGGRLFKSFCNEKMYSPMSEKQAFWVALAFCHKNGLDMAVVNKYWK